MLKYFTNKLKEANSKIESYKNSIIKHAQLTEIKEILSDVKYLNTYQEKFRELTKDACINLTVIEVIELYNANLLSKYDAEYTFKYDRTCTLAERDLLTKLSYGFRDAKVK